ncbi:MAG: ATP phosphoribosyltransferase regulatory subunit [Solirubrobacteraceae bacterium]|nr:ATP phosphoribosyltransferase regulatory subunit [Solirubrobacteraceae bacterium]
MARSLEPATTVRAGEVVRLPPGSRDVLPEEARELRAITEGVRAEFESAGYGEVKTPTLEYADVLARGELGDVTPSYRLVDDRGAWLSLRSDMTVPIARVAAMRYPADSEPLRFWYDRIAYQPVPALQGRAHEVQQIGIELIGIPGGDGDREILGLAARALDAVGLSSARLVVGDARLSETLLRAVGVSDGVIAAAHDALLAGQIVKLELVLGEAGLSVTEVERVVGILRTRGSAQVLAEHATELGDPGAELAATIAALPEAERARVIVDIGLVRDLDYYSGLVFDAVHPALGEPMGGGGRYDDLVGRFGADRPAVGFALAVDAVHRAQTLGGGA